MRSDDLVALPAAMSDHQLTQLSNHPISGSHHDALLADALHRVWGFSDFRPLQREAMHAILDRRDSVVVLPTGGGKSLCFQAPAIVDSWGDPPAGGFSAHPAELRPGPADAGSQIAGRRGVALVVSPLISLMKDQVDGLRVDGVAAACLNSAQTAEERTGATYLLSKHEPELA